MFCPHCGNQLPDGAQFCGSCGKSVGNAPAAAVPPTAPAAAPASAPASMPTMKPAPAAFATPAASSAKGGLPLGLSVPHLIAVIVLVIALIFSWQPWGEASASNVAASSLVSELAGSSYQVEEEYALRDLGDYGRVADSYASAASSVGSLLGQSSSSRSTNYGAITGGIAMAWWVCFLAMIGFGAAGVFVANKRRVFLAIAAVPMAIMALAWLAMADSVMDGATSSVALCLVACIAAFVCALVGGKPQAAA